MQHSFALHVDHLSEADQQPKISLVQWNSNFEYYDLSDTCLINMSTLFMLVNLVPLVC